MRIINMELLPNTSIFCIELGSGKTFFIEATKIRMDKNLTVTIVRDHMANSTYTLDKKWSLNNEIKSI